MKRQLIETLESLRSIPSILLAVLLALSSFATAAPPKTKKLAVSDTYHGVTVTEHYRWLEDWKKPQVKKWSERQNKYARKILDKLPHVDQIRRQLTKIMSAKTVTHSGLAHRGGKFFAMKRQPPKQQPFLVVMDSLDDPAAARILVDPGVIDKKGTTAIDWYIPSNNGKLIAVSLSHGGTESGDVHIYETATGKALPTVIPRVNGGTAGGDLAWLPDDSGFFYTRYPRGNERPEVDKDFYQQLYFHKLGTPTKADRFELGKGFPRIAEIQLAMDSRTGRLLVTVQDGDGGEFSHHLRSPKGKWRQFSMFGDRTVQAAFGPNDDLFVVSRAKAPRGKILRVPIDKLDISKAKTIVPQGKDAIVTDFWEKPTVLPTATRLFVTYQLGGPSVIRVFDHQGKPQTAPQQSPVSAVGGLTSLGGDDVLFESESFTQPDAFYRSNSKSSKTVKTALSTNSTVDLSDAKVVREFATSKDGTKVPVNIIIPKGTRRNGSNPCLVYGYGGYGVNITPRFRSTLRVLLDQGVIYAVANIRGGAEYGEDWHLQGNLTKKQNVFDDFAAVLKHMIDRGYTQPSKLAILGGSNGGLLMGATLTQHSKLFKCAISHVGIYDMLRVELSPNGAFNIPEFGTVKNPDHFRALYGYSPYHNVIDGTYYPATLFLTGANDPRVDPMQSRKFTARLQAATSSSAPILLRTSASSGHGLDTALSERIEQAVDVNAFLFNQLGLKFRSEGAAAE